MKVDPFEFSADQKEELKKSKKKLLTKEKIIGIVDSEIEQFKRLDHVLIVSVLEKLRTKIQKIN